MSIKRANSKKHKKKNNNEDNEINKIENRQQKSINKISNRSLQTLITKFQKNWSKINYKLKYRIKMVKYLP